MDGDSDTKSSQAQATVARPPSADHPSPRSPRPLSVALAGHRQEPGLHELEAESGFVNVVIDPDLFRRERRVSAAEPFLFVDGILQGEDGVTSVLARRVRSLRGARGITESASDHPPPRLGAPSHDFH